MNTSKMVVSVAVVIAIAATSAYGTPWTWTTLDYPGASKTSAYGIDGNKIVGAYNHHYGFLYNGSTWTPLNYPGGIGTAAYGIDGNNTVGYRLDAPAGYQVETINPRLEATGPSPVGCLRVRQRAE